MKSFKLPARIGDSIKIENLDEEWYVNKINGLTISLIERTTNKDPKSMDYAGDYIITSRSIGEYETEEDIFE